MYLTAFITLTQYLEHGGILEHQHQFYYKNADNTYHETGWYEAELQNGSTETTIVKNVNRSWESINDLLYVMIPVAPVMAERKFVEVRTYKDDTVVKAIEVTGQSNRSIVRVDSGLNINLNHDDYYTTIVTRNAIAKLALP